MPSLKALRSRIGSVKSTQKITSAMKMVAASKLRRAQTAAEAARPYAERLRQMLAAVAPAALGNPLAPKLLLGTGRDQVHLLLVITADRGLAGAFNANVARLARNRARELMAAGKTVKIFTVGRKGRDALKREFAASMLGEAPAGARAGASFAEAEAIASQLVDLAHAGAFDVCTLIYNRFQSVISQQPTTLQLIPPELPATTEAGAAMVESEPEDEVLAQLLPHYVAVEIHRARLENAVGFFGSQMTAMDNATRNAGDMIKSLTLNYNRARQANITKELIEIISGAEAV
jgi:F-type H+-transporting ATPase subunit gamma